MTHNIDYTALDSVFSGFVWDDSSEDGSMIGISPENYTINNRRKNVLVRIAGADVRKTYKTPTAISINDDPNMTGWHVECWMLSDKEREIFINRPALIPDRRPESSSFHSFEHSMRNDDRRLPLVIAICGLSGSGKTTLSLALQKRYNIYSIVSCTTRPMRPTETDGVEHKFKTIEDMPDKSDMLAYTFFGGNHYWADFRDIADKDVVTYTIDEQGILDLYEMKRQGRIRLLWIQIERPVNDVDQDRKNRDDCRQKAIDELNSKRLRPHIYIENVYKNEKDFLDMECPQIYEFLQREL